MIIGFKAKDVTFKLGIGMVVVFAILFVFCYIKRRRYDDNHSRKS